MLIRGPKPTLFLDVSENTEDVDIMLYVEEWTFTGMNGAITGALLVALVAVYIMLQRYQVERKCELHEDCSHNEAKSPAR